MSKENEKPNPPPPPMEVIVHPYYLESIRRICEQNRRFITWDPPCVNCGGSPCTVFSRKIQIYCNDCGCYTEEVDTQELARKNWETGIVFTRGGAA